MISLAGLSSTWLVALGASGLAVISMLYLLRLRRRQVVVPFLPLWKRVVQRKQYQSLFERLKRLFSWLLQLLFWGLLLLALADPRLRAELLSGRQVVMILDTSASMKSAEGKGGQTRIKLARQKVLKQIDRLVGQDRMMLVTMDREVIPLTPFTSDKALLKRKLKSVRVSDTAADLRRALWLAEDALMGRKKAEILVVSDGAFGPLYKELLVPLPGEKKARKDKPKPRPRKRTTKLRKDDPVPGQRAAPTKRKAKKSKKKKARRRRRRRRRARRRRRRRARRRRRRRARRRRKRRRRRRRRRKKPPKRRKIDLPEGMKRKLDLSSYAVESETLRKLPAFRMLGIGKMKDNVGIVALSARRQPEHPLRFAAYIEIQNFSKSAAAGFLELYVNELIVETVQLQIGPGKRLRRTFRKLLAQGQKLEARLVIKQGLDQLKEDNRAYAVLPKSKPPSVLMVSNENLYLHAALLSDPQISYRNIKCKAYPPSEGNFDIVIFNGCGPSGELPKEGRFVFFDPPEKGTPFSISRSPRRMLKSPLVTDQRRSHPVMQFVTMRDINIANAVRIRKRRGDIPLVSSFTKPLVLARKEKGRISLVVGFSLRQTDLPLRVAFPLFVRNTLQWMMRGGRPEPPTTRKAGELWRIDVPMRLKKVMIELPPEGKKKQPALEVPVREGQVLFAGKFAGFYRITGAGGYEQWLAANLADVQESTIQPRALRKEAQTKKGKKSDVEPETTFSIAGFKIPIPRPLWLFLLLLALFLLSLEWWTYNRRMTV